MIDQHLVPSGAMTLDVRPELIKLRQRRGQRGDLAPGSCAEILQASQRVVDCR